jgi:polar amino acid transport system substrate-binding protein
MNVLARARPIGIALWFAGLGTVAAAHAEGLQLFTLDAPPMTMIEAPVGDHAHGFVADIAIEAAKRAGYTTNLQFLPWVRGQQLASEGENALITPLARTPEREATYTWVAPIYRLQRAFATLDRQIDSFEDARARLRSILVGRGSAQEATLHSMGFDDGRLQHVEIGVSEIDMLRQGRVDAWFNSTIETEWKWRRSGETAPLVFGRTLYTDEIYLACSKRCAPTLVDKLRAALAAVAADGTAALIEARYLGSS